MATLIQNGAVANEHELSKLGKAVAEFKARYAQLADTAYGAAIARTGDNELMQEYGNVLARAKQIKRAIETIEGAWSNAKEWAGLSAFPVVSLAVVAGVTASVLAGISLIDDFMMRADAKRLMQADPTLDYETALRRAENANRSVYERTIDTAQLALVVGGGLLLYLVLRR